MIVLFHVLFLSGPNVNYLMCLYVCVCVCVCACMCVCVCVCVYRGSELLVLDMMQTMAFRTESLTCFLWVCVTVCVWLCYGVCVAVLVQRLCWLSDSDPVGPEINALLADLFFVSDFFFLCLPHYNSTGDPDVIGYWCCEKMSVLPAM